MKKVFYGMLAGALAFTMLLTGCSKEPVTLDVQAAADTLKSEAPVDDSLAALSDAMFSNLYDVQDADVQSRAAYTSAEATADEIVVIEAKDTDAAARVKEAMETRVADQISTFESYAPAEVAKLNDAVIEVRDKYVILCVCSDAAQARDAIDKLFS